ncbi:MAG: hypothetical protein JXR13_08155 [Thalassovita sp.]
MIPSSFAETGWHFASNRIPPTRFQVIGERSSGTNYVKRLLGRNTTLQPTEALGWKHGYPQMMAIPADLVVILSVRDAVSWVRSMHAKPWHTPPQMQALELSEFMRAPWETIIDRDRYFQPDAKLGISHQPLQQDRNLVTGAPYPNLLRLRQGKMQSHLSFFNRNCAFALVQLESVIAAPEAFLAQFSEGFGLDAPIAPHRPVVKRLGAKFKPSIETRPDTPKTLSVDDMAFLKDNLNLPLEAALGYQYNSPQ